MRPSDPKAKLSGLGAVPGMLSDGTRVEYWKRIYYKDDGDGFAIITGCNTIVGGVLEVPNHIDDMIVGKIDDIAFSNHVELTEVTVPDTIVAIGYGAFLDCPALTNVTMGAGVSDIGLQAFGTRSARSNISRIEFSGDAPAVGGDLGLDPKKCTVHYHGGTAGWAAAKTWQGCATTMLRNENCLNFESDNAFSIEISDHTAPWVGGSDGFRGVLYWSTDGLNWKQWGGKKIEAAAVGVGSTPFYRLCLRGNTYIRRMKIGRDHKLVIMSSVPNGKVECHGNIETLRGATGNNRVPGWNCDIPDNCYENFFRDCTALKSAPLLQAPSSCSRYCYMRMFEGCSSLEEPPALSFRFSSDNCPRGCYWGMFLGCTSLKTAPELPSDYVPEWGYNQMFEGCASLTNAPALPATNIDEYGCCSMFKNCTSLTALPVMQRFRSHEGCCEEMFSGCTGVNVSCNPPGTPWTLLCHPAQGDAGWNYNMFLNVSGGVPATPEKNTTYYVSPSK